MSWTAAVSVGTGIACLGAAHWGTGRVLAWLRERQILDHPNERSSHSLPTPRGGGLAVTPVAVAAWGGLAAFLLPSAGWILWMAVAAAGLAAISWLDDRRSLPALPRFLAHAVAVAGGLALLPDGAPVFHGWLPVWLDRLLAGLCWLWFVNLYNFMDGIDGITGVETATIGLGVAAVSLAGAGQPELAPLGVAVAGAGIGFLAWNWSPARIFLGDTGSIPLGLLLGGLLVRLAAAGQLAAALILPAYYLADATITISRRALRGEKVWQPHRQHFYQRAVQGGKSHAQVARAVLAANVALAALALASVSWPWPALAGAVAVVGLLLIRLQTWSRGAA